jgi:hypothetical protein
VALDQNMLDGERCLGWRKPGNVHAPAENQREGTCVRDPGALLQVRRFQNLYVQQVPGPNGQAFRLRTACGYTTE